MAKRKRTELRRGQRLKAQIAVLNFFQRFFLFPVRIRLFTALYIVGRSGRYMKWQEDIWHILQHRSQKLMLPETKKLFETVKQYLGEPSQDEGPYFAVLENEGKR